MHNFERKSYEKLCWITTTAAAVAPLTTPLYCTDKVFFGPKNNMTFKYSTPQHQS